MSSKVTDPGKAAISEKSSETTEHSTGSNIQKRESKYHSLIDPVLLQEETGVPGEVFGRVKLEVLFSHVTESTSSSIASPPSRLSNIAKFFKSPRKQVGKDEQTKQTKSKTKKSSRKGKAKSKNIEINVEDSSSDNKNRTKECSSKTKSFESTGDTDVMGSEHTTASPRQDHDLAEEEKGASSTTGRAEDSSTCSSPGQSKDQDVLSTPGQAVGKDSGKRSMVQTSLSTTKDYIEVISSPEQQPAQKKKGKKGRSKRKDETDKTQTKITNIFPVRKSNRKTKAQQEKDEQTRITKAILSKSFEGLEVRTTEGKGRGVFASRGFARNEFVCEYSGELISFDEAKKREKQYNEDRNIGCYMYYLQCNNKKYCIDATAEDGTFGRLLNHSRSGNCKTKIHVIEDQPHLIFVTTCDIKVGEELSYDYGERSKDVIESHPWLKY